LLQNDNYISHHNLDIAALEGEKERVREKVYSPQCNNTAVKTVSNNTKWRVAREAQGQS